MPGALLRLALSIIAVKASANDESPAVKGVMRREKGKEGKLVQRHDHHHPEKDEKATVVTPKEALANSKKISTNPPHVVVNNQKPAAEVQKAVKAAANNIATAKTDKEQEEAGQKLLASLGLSYSELDPDANAEAHGKDAFFMRVVGPSGIEKCIGEHRNGYHVHASRCLPDHNAMKWYWDGKRLKNLMSNDRCLGYALHSSGTSPLSMFDCHDTSEMEAAAKDGVSDVTLWEIDKDGRLKSEGSNLCMNLDEEDKHHSAKVTPCEDEVKA